MYENHGLGLACLTAAVAFQTLVTGQEMETRFIPEWKEGMTWEVVFYALTDTSGVISASEFRWGLRKERLKYYVDDYREPSTKTEYVRIEAYGLDVESEMRDVGRHKGALVAQYFFPKGAQSLHMFLLNERGIEPGVVKPIVLDAPGPAYQDCTRPLEIAVWPQLRIAERGPVVAPQARQVEYSDLLPKTTITQFSHIVDMPTSQGSKSCLRIALVPSPVTVSRTIRTQIWMEGVPWWIQWSSTFLTEKLVPRAIYGRLVRWTDAKGKAHELGNTAPPLGLSP